MKTRRLLTLWQLDQVLGDSVFPILHSAQTNATGLRRRQMRPGWEGLLLFWLHRLSGVGVVLFLLAHISDTVLVLAGPRIYDSVMAAFASPPFRLLETLLIAAVVFHAFNGLRILVCDLWPVLCRRRRQLMLVEAVFVLTISALAAMR